MTADETDISPDVAIFFDDEAALVIRLIEVEAVLFTFRFVEVAADVTPEVTEDTLDFTVEVADETPDFTAEVTDDAPDFTLETAEDALDFTLDTALEAVDLTAEPAAFILSNADIS